MKKVIKNFVKIVALFGFGLAIGKLIHKHVCKKYVCEPLTTEVMIPER